MDCLCLYKIQIIHSKWAYPHQYESKFGCSEANNMWFACVMHFLFEWLAFYVFFFFVFMLQHRFDATVTSMLLLLFQYGLYFRDRDLLACLSDANINKHKMKNKTANNNENRLKTDLSVSVCKIVNKTISIYIVFFTQ